MLPHKEENLHQWFEQLQHVAGVQGAVQILKQPLHGAEKSQGPVCLRHCLQIEYRLIDWLFGVLRHIISAISWGENEYISIHDTLSKTLVEQGTTWTIKATEKVYQ